ncbi:MAG TPA: hypothetical protein VKB89_09105 [Xanthobacteraceae bacterium]|nr:hypothetical protein [Xanthobacteraceae bacterium]
MIKWLRALAGALALVPPVGEALAQGPQLPLNTLNEVSAALRACWVPPPIDQSHAGMQITVRMSFRRNGELFGPPRITFESTGASDDERLAYRIAVAKMIKRCAPLPFSDALGNALAGRPFTIRLIDDRKLRQAEKTHDECREHAHN